MFNFKHTAIAIASIAIIGSLAVNQMGEFIKRPVDAELLSHRTSKSISIEEAADEKSDSDISDNSEIVSDTNNKDSKKEDKKESSDTAAKEAADNESGTDESEAAAAEEESSDITKDMSDEELASLIEKKSKPQTSYIMLTSGTLEIKAEPSSESQTIDAVECLSNVNVLSTAEGWSYIQYGTDGRKGYVPSSKVTDSKEEAEFAAKHYDNYMKATISPKNADVVRVRKSPSTSSEIVAELEKGSTVYMLWNEGDFVKVIYGPSHQEGYMIASALTMTYEWTSKSQIENERAEIKKRAEEETARKKAEEEAKKKAQEEAKKKAEEEAKKKAAAVTVSKTSGKSSAPTAVSNAPASSKGQAIVNEAKKYLGTKYVYGGAAPGGFDCSGLVKYVFAKNGVSLSRTSASQARQGVTVSKNNLQPGDLLFFAKNGRVHHVGIYVGGGQMIHAPHTGSKVKYDSINTAYRQKEFYCAKRVY